MKLGTRILILFVAVLALSTSLIQVASAASFNPNNLIDDAVFNDKHTMTPGQINDFLNTFPNSCISPNKGFSAVVPTGYSPSTGYTYGGYASAGQVIYEAAQAYDINPQVLLTTLQKEQSLVSGGSSTCTVRAYASATGYGCPDNIGTFSYSNVSLYAINGNPVTSIGSTCVDSVQKVGFSQQVIRAAWLLKFSQQRALGNYNWAIIRGSWNNTDDSTSCYSGAMTQGTFKRCPSSPATYYDGYTTIDGSSVHMDTGATAALYRYTPHFHGNQNFGTIFQNWFGSLIGSDLVRSANNATVYLLSGNTKHPISEYGVLADFSSLGAVKFVSDAYLASYTTGPLAGHMVGGSDGTLYFLDAGIKLPFSSCDMVAQYGYSCASVITLTDAQLNKFVTGPYATQLYKTTSGRLFYITSGQKREVFDAQSLTQAGISAGTNTLLDQGISYLPYGPAIGRDGVVVRSRDNGGAYLYDNSKYIALNGEMNGLGPIASLARINLDEASIAPAQRVNDFTGFVRNSSGSVKYALIDSGKAALGSPTEWTGTYTALSDTTLQALPTSSDPINSRLVKSTNNGTVYYVLGGQKRPIPSWTDLVNLKPQPLVINTLAPSQLATIPTGRLIYAPGTMVKTNNSATVYVVKSDTELLPITSFMIPQDLGGPDLLETMSTADFGNYTVGSNLHTKITCSGQDFIGINGKLYPMDAAALAEFGFVHADFMDVGAPLCNVLPQSSQSPPVFLLGSNGTIYKVQSGSKHAFTGYGAYVANGGTPQNTVKVSDYFLGLISTGSNISQ